MSKSTKIYKQYDLKFSLVGLDLFGFVLFCFVLVTPNTAQFDLNLALLSRAQGTICSAED